MNEQEKSPVSSRGKAREIDSNKVNQSEGFLKNKVFGWVCLYRGIKYHWLWQDPEKLKWWLDILISANHSPQKVVIGNSVITCNRGQCIKSLGTWAQEWRVDIGRVRRFLKLLSSDSMIVTENVSKTTRITICNYDSYNDLRQDNEKITTRSRQDGDKITTTNNNGNNVDNKNNEDIYARVRIFYNKEIEANSSHEHMSKYKKLVEALFGDNPTGYILSNILTMKQQVTFKGYCSLFDLKESIGGNLLDILLEMNNYKGIERKQCVVATARNWLKRNADKENVQVNVERISKYGPLKTIAKSPSEYV